MLAMAMDVKGVTIRGFGKVAARFAIAQVAPDLLTQFVAAWWSLFEAAQRVGRQIWNDAAFT